MKKTQWLKIIAFLLVFCCTFGVLQKIVSNADYRNYQWVRGFYAEKDDTLDAVYLGSSNCYAFWNPLAAWEKYGIAVWPYASSAQPIIATEHLMKEVRKSQPDAVFVVNTNNIGEAAFSAPAVHNLLDYMPFSFNKLSLTNRLASAGDFTKAQVKGFYIPMIRYHSRWNSLVAEDFSHPLNGYKGAAHYSTYLGDVLDITDKYITIADCKNTEEVPFDEHTENAVNSLISYCKAEDIKVVFVTVPRANEKTELVKIDRLNKKLAEAGFDVLDLTEKLEETGIDPADDYYNETHTNIHGSIKFTQYISEYLIEKYGFENKRSDPAYVSWNEGLENYKATYMNKYVLDFELDPDVRDYALPTPENFAAEAKGKTVFLSWDACEGADGYVIYKKDAENSDYYLLGSTEETSFTDSDVAAGSGNVYGYTVAPYRTSGGKTLYGDAIYKPVYAQP